MVASVAGARGVPFSKGLDRRRFGGGRSPRVIAPDGTKKTLAEIAREGTLDSLNVLHLCVLDKGEDMNVRIRAPGYLPTLGRERRRRRRRFGWWRTTRSPR